MSNLFSPLEIRGETIRNRVFVSPMCQYSSETDGLATSWHMVHLGSRAAGGAGLVMAEATAVRPEGRISPWDQGLWSGAQVDALRPITEFISSQGAVPAVQLAHAGRKASHAAPWDGAGLLDKAGGGWPVVGPSTLPFDEESGMPAELSKREIVDITQAFADAAARSVDAGYRVVEVHLAHGYLANEFLSPLSNRRSDEYGGSLENRSKFALGVVAAVRAAVPDTVPLFARISATEYVDGGWDIEQSVQLSKWLKAAGVDLVDCSSGGNSPEQVMPLHPGYQVPFAAEIRERAGVMTGAVGLITRAEQAEAVLTNGEADAIFLGRELLRNPYWPLYAQARLDGDARWPKQYARSVDGATYTGPGA